MRRTIVLLLASLALAGCQDNKREQAQSLASRAAFLAQDGEYTEAIPLFEEATRLRPDCVEYHVGLAMAYVHTDDHRKAKEEYEKALPILREQAASDPERVDDLVMVLVCLNRSEEARSVLSEAEQKFKDNRTVALLTRDYDSMTAAFSELAVEH